MQVLLLLAMQVRVQAHPVPVLRQVLLLLLLLLLATVVWLALLLLPWVQVGRQPLHCNPPQ
jgi:hypothetical protein